MKEEINIWIKFAEENLSSAYLLSDNQLYNPCLQNCQQAVEKFLKACIIKNDLPIMRTHSIMQLIDILSNNGVRIDIDLDEIDLLDSVYLPSKYPLGNAMPDFHPDEHTCNTVLEIVVKVRTSALSYLEGHH